MKSELNTNTIEIHRLKTIPLFHKLEEEQLKQIASAGKVLSMNKGGFFFFQNDLAEVVYVLLTGRIKLSQYSAEGQRVLRQALPPYTAFGARALAPRGRYSVTAEAAEDCTVLALDQAALLALAEEIPQMAHNAMALLSGDGLQARRTATSVRVERRLALTLLRLAAQTGMKTGSDVVLNLPLSRQELAQMTGMSPRSVGRILAQWEQKNLVKTGQEQFVINPHELTYIAEDLPLETA
jgi:CRP-like cAMP-binding protein